MEREINGLERSGLRSVSGPSSHVQSSTPVRPPELLELTHPHRSPGELTGGRVTQAQMRGHSAIICMEGHTCAVYS